MKKLKNKYKKNFKEFKTQFKKGNIDFLLLKTLMYLGLICLVLSFCDIIIQYISKIGAK